MVTSGVADVDIQIGSLKFEWPIYIAPIGDQLLLGCDVIYDKDITINTRRGLEVLGEWIDCEVVRKMDKIARVVLKETVTIPPDCEVILAGQNVNSKSLDTRYCSIEPLVEDERNILVTRCVVDPYKDTIPIRLVNLEKFPVKIKKNYLLGELLPVIHFENFANEEVSTPLLNSIGPDIMSGGFNTDGTCIPRIPDDWRCCKVTQEEGEEGKLAEIPKLPEHLVGLFEKSSAKLTNHAHKVTFAEVLLQNSDAFAENKSNLGSCSVDTHKINTAGAKPIRQPLRRTPLGFEGEEKYLKDQIDNGVVKPSKSSWASPVCLVRKKDGSVRWCIDYRRLNDCTIKDAYPLPKISMCLDCLADASIFSVMDLQAGYWQLEVASEDRHLTAFITKYGLFEYTMMPFGLCNAPSTFQRCMELIFRGMQWKTLLIYLDDIILYSSNLESHFDKLGEVLSRLIKSGLKLKPSKCEFLKDEVVYLGHVVSKEGIKPNPKVIDSVSNWKTPGSVKDVQRFLGLCNYYRQFVPKFSEIASPLSTLTKQDTRFQWSVECDDSFKFLKNILCKTPVLACPRDRLCSFS